MLKPCSRPFCDRAVSGVTDFCKFCNNIRRKHGLTNFEFLSLFAQENCGICEQPFGPNRRSCVDHDHATGEVRGLLCYPCNSGLGMFQDNIPLLRRAIAYLIESRL